MKQQSTWRTVAPLLLLVVFATAVFWSAMGDDLASSFVGCRVLATGAQASLYSHDPVNFAAVSDTDPVWPSLARQGGYSGYLHPYVQTPLWAWALQPLCRSLRWASFKHLFLFLALLSAAGVITLAARFWTPRWFTRTSLAVLFVMLLFSEPFFFAMKLVQTHVLLLFLTVAGLLCAEHRRPVLGGALVAGAAAVKVTPAVLLLYWLATRRWRAALSLAVSSLLLLAATRVAVGRTLFHDFLSSMHRVSDVLLVAENNQSLAATVMGHRFPPDEVFDVNAFALPRMLKDLSLLLMASFTWLGGWLDHRANSAAETQDASEPAAAPPFGLGMALIAMTIFAPIAWTHYFIVLVIPFMMLAQAAVALASRRRRLLLWCLLAAAAALLYRPLAPDVVNMDLSDAAVLRGEFLSGSLVLLFCLVAAVLRAQGHQNPVLRRTESAWEA